MQRSRKKTIENVSPLLHGAGNLMAQDMEKAAVLNAFFASVFSARASLQESWVPEAKGKGWRKECIPFVEGNPISKHLFKLDIHNSMGLDGMHPGVLRKLVTGRSVSGMEEGKCHPYVQERQEGEPRDLQASQPRFTPQKSDGAAKHFPGTFHEDKKVIMSTMHGFIKETSSLSSLITFCYQTEVTGLVDEGRAVNIVCLDLHCLPLRSAWRSC